MDGSNSSPLLEHYVSLAAFGALSVQIWDLMSCLSDEVEYLWRGRVTYIKALYICARYLMLLAQIINQIFSFLFDKHLTRSWLCPGIFVYKTVISQTALLFLEMILFIRVYALYNQGYMAKRILLSVLVLSTALEFTGTGMVIHTFAEVSGCAPRQANQKGIQIFGYGAGLSQLVVVLSTLARIISVRRRVGSTRTPLTSLMLRQGLSTFFIVFALLAVMIAYAIVTDIDVNTGDAALSWYVSLLSIGASRLVLQTRKLVFYSEDNEEDEANSLCLTVISE